MKLITLVISLIISLTSCFRGENGMNLSKEDYEAIADKTFSQIIAAITLKDNSKLKALFSDEIIAENDRLDEESKKLIEFLRGDIISYSSSSEAGVGTDYKSENGKTLKEIQSTFCITTTENKYFIAVKECVRDDFNDSNIGVLSIYIIESNNWDQNYIYRGDGKWTYGINIEDNIGQH